MRRLALGIAVSAGVWLGFQPSVLSQAERTIRIHGTSADDLRRWDAYVIQRERSGELRRRTAERDPAMPGRTVERLDQFHRGVRIWGSEIVRDLDGTQARAIFGVLAPDLNLAVDPALSADEVRPALLRDAGNDATLLTEPELLIVSTDDGEYRLAYMAVASGTSGINRVFVSAQTGAELLRYSELQTQAAVGSGRGVLGDTKKLSVLGQAGTFTADDQHRPPILRTFDMRGSLNRAITVLNGGTLFVSDLASDSDNNWSDVANVDAHVHIGWTYDFFFKRFGRRGLDNNDRPIAILTNTVTQQGALTAPADVFFQFVVNAFWCGACGPGGIGLLTFGNGMPPNFFLTSTGNNYTYFSGALDIAAHELAHGVTDSSSRLIYRNESGALNEAFSDVMGTSVEHFFHPSGTGKGRADYLLGEDISTALRPGSRDGDRSLENPTLYGQPDHYSRRYLGLEDNGGVHINSGIANHAFFLAIEGGVHRTSGQTVQGVGAANREQIEKVFYRAFVFLLPSNATFATARAATIQAARDLYGAGSNPERAVTQAWTAVGVL
jgi:bacillolysin